MSKRCCKCECKPCRCEKKECCCQGNNSGYGYGDGLSGFNSSITPIIFLLIACGSGLLGSNSSVLIILLFLLCGGDSVTNLFGSC